MPVPWVNRWLPDPAAVLGRPVDASQGWGAALRAFKEAMTPEFAAQPGLPPSLVTDQLGALMSLAYGAAGPSMRNQNAGYQRCLRAMQERFGDHTLTAADIAAQSAVSLRSLHRTFAAAGTTFAGVLREMRLKQAHRMLSDSRFARLPIADCRDRAALWLRRRFAFRAAMSRGVGPDAGDGARFFA